MITLTLQDFIHMNMWRLHLCMAWPELGYVWAHVRSNNQLRNGNRSKQYRKQICICNWNNDNTMRVAIWDTHALAITTNHCMTTWDVHLFSTPCSKTTMLMQMYGLPNACPNCIMRTHVHANLHARMQEKLAWFAIRCVRDLHAYMRACIADNNPT